MFYAVVLCLLFVDCCLLVVVSGLYIFVVVCCYVFVVVVIYLSFVVCCLLPLSVDC